MHSANDKLILITLLVELGVAAAVGSSLARSSRFKLLLLQDRRRPRQTAELLTWICVPLMLGVGIRVRVPNFLAADISLEATALVGLLLGPVGGMAAGFLLALPALLHGEYLSLPVNLLIGLLLGSFRSFIEEEDVWSFSPMIDLSIYRWVRRTVEFPHLDRQIALLVTLMAVAFGSSWLSHLRPKLLFDLWSPSWLVELAVCACAPIVVGIPLKLWNAARLEQKFEQQSRLLLEARFDALQRQINPHFLFNTLNSIGSLIRSKPELAREMIVKLANILRVLLKDRDAFVPFSEELAFTDDYLAIEVVRFGEKLRVVKEIAEETLDVVVPSMLLQPLIENSIKHGLEPRISGGTVTVRSRVEGGCMIVEVEDDGVGTEAGRAAISLNGPTRESGGIGMKNVRERMRVLYGEEAQVEFHSRPGARDTGAAGDATAHGRELARPRAAD